MQPKKNYWMPRLPSQCWEPWRSCLLSCTHSCPPLTWTPSNVWPHYEWAASQVDLDAHQVTVNTQAVVHTCTYHLPWETLEWGPHSSLGHGQTSQGPYYFAWNVHRARQNIDQHSLCNNGARNFARYLRAEHTTVPYLKLHLECSVTSLTCLGQGSGFSLLKCPNPTKHIYWSFILIQQKYIRLLPEILPSWLHTYLIKWW